MFCPYRFCGYSHDDVEILALAECRNGLDHLSGDAHIGAIGAPRGVRGEDDAWNRTERIVGSERLVFEHIERRRNVASLESGEQCARFDDFRTGRVDEHGSRFQSFEVFRSDDAFCGVQQRHMDGYHVGTGKWEFHADTFMPKAPAMRATV